MYESISNTNDAVNLGWNQTELIIIAILELFDKVLNRSLLRKKQVSMDRKYHSHRPQTNIQHLELGIQNMDSHIKARTPCADPERGTWGSGLSPLKNRKNIGFLSNTGPDPLKKNHKAAKPAFNNGSFIGSRAKRHLNGVSLAGR